jgi:hypothetical protein
VENIFIDNRLAISMNSEGTGEITSAKKATILARPGKLELNFKPITALDGTPIDLIMGEKRQKKKIRDYI